MGVGCRVRGQLDTHQSLVGFSGSSSANFPCSAMHEDGSPPGVRVRVRVRVRVMCRVRVTG